MHLNLMPVSEAPVSKRIGVCNQNDRSVLTFSFSLHSRIGLWEAKIESNRMVCIVLEKPASLPDLQQDQETLETNRGESSASQS